MRLSLTPKGRLFLLTIFLLSLVAGYFYRKYRPPYGFYAELARRELTESRRLINGFGHKYVKFRQLQGAGFNNQAQEILLFHHLALLTNRIYVYQPFMWRHRLELQPLSGFLLGPTKGSLSSALFEEVCPPEEVRNVTINVEPYAEMWRTAQDILNGPERCIYVENWILNWRFLESPAIHDIWPAYKTYLSQYYEWPSHILDMIYRAGVELNLRSHPALTDGEPYLAIHFRRGDFEEHCQYLSKTQQPFTSWSTLPDIQSHSAFPPRLDTSNETSIMEHCYPTLDRILDTIDAQVRNRPHLRSVYVLHDGAWDHLPVYWQYYKIERALKNSARARKAGWKGDTVGMRFITHSGMTPVKPGERDWKVAVDVELARRAEVFIGNGFSSLTSQIVALRLADGGKAEDITIL
ncbi:unnamed protein product [Somion occarium]|uniref:O-fucosyltransferase family protein n=1 Tax=Somion occarium TaxID=3059160 RepID=A0ABP1DYP8_9APHY